MGELYVKILNALFFSVFKMRGTTVKLKKKKREYGVGTL